MKKFFILLIALAIVSFFILPSGILADEGDTEKFIGVEDKETMNGVHVGQYKMGDGEDGGDPEDTAGDGDTEVFCIDGDTTVNNGETGFTNTGVDVTEDESQGGLVGEDAPLDDDDEDGVAYKNDENDQSDNTNPNQTDGEIDEVEANAIKIISTEETGATSIEDQVAVWEETGDKEINIPASSSSKNSNVDKIVESTEQLATEFVELEENTNADPNDDVEMEEFLDDKNVNEIEITVDEEPLFEDGDNDGVVDPTDEDDIVEHTATATMEEPLVPGITDEGKSINWYILEGSFNISFAKDSLVTEGQSTMNDYEDDNDGNNSTTDSDSDGNIDGDDDGDGEVTGDNYGKSEINYYYFYWGLEQYPEGTIGVNLFAWADVDEDGKFDIVDEEYNDAIAIEDVQLNGTQTQQISNNFGPDGDVVGEFQDKHQIVQTENGGVKTDSNGDVVTEPLSTDDMDIHTVKGGQIIKKDDSTQRFTTLSYTEPYNVDPKYSGSILFKYTGDDVPLEGATFEIRDSDNNLVDTLVSDENGMVKINGLSWGTFTITETAAPAGYDPSAETYTITVGGDGIYLTGEDEETTIIPFSVENTPTPPPPPPDTPDTPDTPPDGGTTEVVEVLGIQELPYTGYDKIFLFAGLALLLSASIFFSKLLIDKRKARNWHHVWGKIKE